MISYLKVFALCIYKSGPKVLKPDIINQLPARMDAHIQMTLVATFGEGNNTLQRMVIWFSKAWKLILHPSLPFPLQKPPEDNVSD